MSFEVMLRALLSNETTAEIKEDYDFYLKKNPRFCVCCGKRLTAEDVMGSQGYHCVECFGNLVFDDKYYYCALHDELPSHLKHPWYEKLDDLEEIQE